MRIMRSLAVAGATAMLLVFGAGVASAQIAITPHNLASGDDTLADNNEICVYCHTPHGAEVSIEAPLWNKPASGASYQSYDSTTIDGTILAVGSVSIACLSCHDGTQAMDTVINAPGSGNYNPGGASMGTIAANGGLMPTGIANLTADLRDDHPIGVQYGGFDPGTGQIDIDFVNAAGALQTANINGADRWWVDTEGTPNDNRDKTDMILYTRDNGGSDEPFVECASCHDPHSAANDTFLRISNSNSDVCLACHVK